MKKLHQPDLIPPDLPFDGQDFAEAWASWETFRREIKKPLPPTARNLQFQLIKAMGKATAIASIEQSINSNWTGLFMPKTQPAGFACQKQESAWSIKQRIEAAENLILEIQGLASFKNLPDEKKAKIRAIRANVRTMQEKLALCPP